MSFGHAYNQSLENVAFAWQEHLKHECAHARQLAVLEFRVRLQSELTFAWQLGGDPVAQHLGPECDVCLAACSP